MRKVISLTWWPCYNSEVKGKGGSIITIIDYAAACDSRAWSTAAGKWLSHYDNASAHITISVIQFLENIYVVSLPNALYRHTFLPEIFPIPWESSIYVHRFNKNPEVTEERSNKLPAISKDVLLIKKCILNVISLSWKMFGSLENIYAFPLIYISTSYPTILV